MGRLAPSILALVVILGSNWPIRAEDGPPTRVGRVSFVEGKLAFHPKGETEWSAASVNHPVATRGSFWTDPKSRAAIRTAAQTLDLSYDTAVDVVRLALPITQRAVPHGRLESHLLPAPACP